jgi:hypothetical protein
MNQRESTNDISIDDFSGKKRRDGDGYDVYGGAETDAAAFSLRFGLGTGLHLLTKLLKIYHRL